MPKSRTTITTPPQTFCWH